MEEKNAGTRLRSMEQIRIGDFVCVYNPAQTPVSRTGGLGEIGALEETTIQVNDYYLGCFQRGALLPLLDVSKEPQPKSNKETTPSLSQKEPEPSCLDTEKEVQKTKPMLKHSTLRRSL